MGGKQSSAKDFVKKQTLVTSVVVALMVGFVAGVVFGVYKSSTPLPGGTAGNAPGAEGRQRMMQVLLDRLKTNPNDAASWVQLGNIHFDGGRHPEAIEAYEKALEIQPGNAAVLTDLGIMYRRTGKPKEAVKRFDEAIAADPKLENPRFNKGVVLLHDLDDREGAIKAWEGLMEVNPLAMAPNGQSVDELVTHYRDHPEN